MTVYTNAASNLELEGQEPREDESPDDEETDTSASGNWQQSKSRKGSS